MISQKSLKENIVIEAQCDGAIAFGTTRGGDGARRGCCQQAEAVSRMRVPPSELVMRVVMATLAMVPIKWSGPSK